MRHFISSLFGCAHRRCTFPITATKTAEKRPATTYIVCLDCGQEFSYDWERMKIVKSRNDSQRTAA